MMTTKKNVFLLLLVFEFSLSIAQNSNDTNRITWFEDAKLGIFIHWGIYAVDGTSESWAFHNKGVPYPTYMSQLSGFTAANYHPDEWVRLIKESGAQYAVLTTQHHDGVALWNTKFTTPRTNEFDLRKSLPNCQFQFSKQFLWNENKPLSVVYQAPAKRDLIEPFVDELRKANIRFGAYYSLLNWSHNDYPTFLKDYNRYQLSTDTIRWNRFLQYMHGQIKEINTQFAPDLFWFDGDWEHSEAEWNAAKIEQLIHATNKKALLNGRLKSYGDYDTPEQNMPIIHPDKNTWELCLTSNDNWGYRPKDKNMKTVNEVLQIFTECIGMGGNLLLDIGPKADGTIPDEQVQLLKAIGRWTSKHNEAIYGTRAGLPSGHFYGPSTLSKDSTCLYLFITGVGLDTTSSDKYISENELAEIKKEVIVVTEEVSLSYQLKGLQSEIESVTVLGTNTPVPYKIVGKIDWSYVPGTVYLKIPYESLDPEITVIKVKLKTKLSLYRGKGGFH